MFISTICNQHYGFIFLEKTWNDAWVLIAMYFHFILDQVQATPIYYYYHLNRVEDEMMPRCWKPRFQPSIQAEKIKHTRNKHQERYMDKMFSHFSHSMWLYLYNRWRGWSNYTDSNCPFVKCNILCIICMMT